MYAFRAADGLGPSGEKRAGHCIWVHRPYTADPKNDMTIFTRNLETPVGPAAGPHTQLAQNIIASYYAGAVSLS